MFENGDVPTFVNCVPNCDSSCPFVKLIPHLNCGVKFMVRVKTLSIFPDFLDEGRPGVRVVMRNLGDAPCTSTPGRHFSPSSGSKAKDLCITLVFLSIIRGSRDQPFTVELVWGGHEKTLHVGDY